MRFRPKLNRASSDYCCCVFGSSCRAQPFIVPVQGAGRGSWNPQSFWYYPWGKSVTHKGVDIFAPEGTPVLRCAGLVLYAGDFGAGGITAAVVALNGEFITTRIFSR